MHVTCGIDIRPSLVKCGVDYETSCVDEFVGTTYAVAVFVDLDHIGDCQQREMHAIGIYPKCVWLYGVYFQSFKIVCTLRMREKHASQADVAASTISESKLGKDAESTRHLFQLPLSFFFFGCRPGNVKSTLGLVGICCTGRVQYGCAFPVKIRF